MKDAELERRFLEFVYTTNAVITAGAVSYYTDCSLAEGEALLDRLTREGMLRIEHTDEGEIYYVYPDRGQIERPAASPVPAARSLPAKAGAAQPRAAAAALSVPAMMTVGGGPPRSPTAPAPVASGTRACPMCGEEILPVAKKCKHCGELLDPELAAQASRQVQVNVGIQNVPAAPLQRGRYISPGIAALLSFLWPGAGQIYAQRVGAGIGWMFFTFIGYLMLIVPGLILHLICIFSAASYASDENARSGYA
jgi:TM2 domain-containing membrane protein YozV